jgi:hypothetical protein
MYALCLQDWTTLRGATSVATFTQPEPGWLDLTAYQDVVTWLEIKEFTPTATNIPTVAYQTSPTKDEALFFNMAPPVVAALGVTTTVMLKDAMPAGFPPCGKWFRWQLIVSGAVAWDLTFRIWIAANLIGNRVALSPATTLADLEKEGYRYGYGEEPPTVTSTPPQVTTPQGGGNGNVGGGGGYANSGQASGGPSKWHLPSTPVQTGTHSGSHVQVNNHGPK